MENTPLLPEIARNAVAVMLGKQPFQIKNLAKLAVFLNAFPFSEERFNMGWFLFDDNGDIIYDHFLCPNDKRTAGPHGSAAILENECGSAGCALGWAYYAGIIPSRGSVSWEMYSDNEFGIETGKNPWLFLFGTANVNCPKAAANRISHYLSGNYKKGDEGRTYSEDGFFVAVPYPVDTAYIELLAQ